ncbi:hypothetical protein F5X99DRAFT_395859 [Biscogniauxia marginata]|nr:hypothetical protein F5X99DRAFT_395859 [Biscogniauxia marginata]
MHGNFHGVALLLGLVFCSCQQHHYSISWWLSQVAMCCLAFMVLLQLLWFVWHRDFQGVRFQLHRLRFGDQPIGSTINTMIIIMPAPQLASW